MIIKGHNIEFVESKHIYLCDGEILPSITQILAVRFGKKYEGIDNKTLSRAAAKGTTLHEAIELYEKTGIESDVAELRDWKFLKKAYKFECIGNEVTVLLFVDGKPFACGRLDLVLQEDRKIGLGDIKRTSVLDKEYLAYQLNLYRIAYMQDYGTKIEFIRGIHLRDGVRKYVNLPINEAAAMELIDEYKEAMKEEDDELLSTIIPTDQI